MTPRPQCFLILFLTSLLIFGVAGPLCIQAQGVKRWTNKEGKAIDAELVGYNEQRKSVIWRMKNGARGESKLADLDAESKWQVVGDSAFSPVLKKRLETEGAEMFLSLFLGGVGIYLLLIVFYIVADYFLFRASVRLIAFSDRDLIAYIKQFLWAILVSILFFVLVFILGAFLSQHDFNLLMIPMQVLLHLVLLGTLIFVVKSHYEISTGSAILIHIVHSVFRFLMVLTFYGVCALLIAISVSWLKDLIDPLFLKPLKLI